MDYSFLDREEYKDIPVYKMAENNNGLPLFIIKMNRCAQIVHRHEYVQIIYVCKGKLKHIINKNTFDVYKGDIFIIPPFVPHYFIEEHSEKYQIIEFEFTPEFINEKFSPYFKDNAFTDFAYLEPFLVSENEIKPRLNLTGSVQKEVESMLNEIIDEYESREDDFELLIKALLLKLLVIVGREFTRSIKNTEDQGVFEMHREALFSAIDYINSNYTGEISFEHASKVAMLSQSYFRYLFKQMTHKTFTEYVNDLRISKAVELLISKKDMKILDICYEAGYNNINHFNRIFRLTTGVTPMTYRKGRV